MNIKKSDISPLVIACMGLLAGIILKLFVIDVLHVSGTSMNPTLKDGSIVIVNKLAYGITSPKTRKLIMQWAAPEPDDIVIYLYNNKIVVKRCIAVSATPLDYSTDPVYTLRVRNKRIPLSESQYYRLKNCSKVPDGYILAIGDNYSLSVDSRTYGFVSIKSIF
jgi:signal peptidase I